MHLGPPKAAHMHRVLIGFQRLVVVRSIALKIQDKAPGNHEGVIAKGLPKMHGLGKVAAGSFAAIRIFRYYSTLVAMIR